MQPKKGLGTGRCTMFVAIEKNVTYSGPTHAS